MIECKGCVYTDESRWPVIKNRVTIYGCQSRVDHCEICSAGTLYIRNINYRSISTTSLVSDGEWPAGSRDCKVKYILCHFITDICWWRKAWRVDCIRYKILKCDE